MARVGTPGGNDAPSGGISHECDMPVDDPIYVALNRYTKALAVALGYRDLLTRLHSERVVGLSQALATHIGLGEPELSILRIGASFHDIGKIGIPDHILLKPGRLDEREWATMQQHSMIGANIIASTELEGAVQAALVIRHHHEHYDGKGYPDGLSGDDIPTCARIVAIADSYDGMAVTRSYHGARAHSEIIDVLHEESGRKLDPKLVAAFCVLIEASPLKTADR